MPGPAPLLVVDAPSLMYRSFHALPSKIRGEGGRPVNALLGTANYLVAVVQAEQPRATVLCWGAEAARYRKELFADYHAARPPMPDELEQQWRDAPTFFDAFGWSSLDADDLEADDLLHALALAEERAGGSTLILTGDRDMYQCASERTTVLYIQTGKQGPQRYGPEQVKERYGVEPSQVPDLIALRGDPSDGIPGAKGIGEKTASGLLQRYGDLEGVLQAAADGHAPRFAATLQAQADQLRDFRRMAEVQDVAVALPGDRPPDFAGGAAAARERGINRLAERLEGLERAGS